MKSLLNSNLLPIISVGMYGSYISPESMFDSYQIDQDKEYGDFEYTAEEYWDNFDNDAYVLHVQQKAKLFLDGSYTLNDITVKVVCGVIYSPREYNFATDQIELSVTYPKAKLRKFAADNYDEFADFLKENYSSCSGFHSYTANNYASWLDEFNSDKEQEVGAILTFWFLVLKESEIYDEFKDMAFEEHLSENTFYSEFFTEPSNMDMSSIRPEFFQPLLTDNL